MSEENECPRCSDERGHYDWELIEIDGKYFCPYDYRRTWTEEEAEEWTEEEIKEIQLEMVQVVRKAAYKIIKVPREASEKGVLDVLSSASSRGRSKE